ncbi:hypothetical protein H7Y29_01485 [Microbacteriaceae bacterium]|nr:hypothetical protein [Candidatus Saccharibacteria bacterium]
MTHHVSPIQIEFGNFQRTYSVDREKDVYVDLDASSLEEINAKSAELEKQLGLLGVAHSKVTGSELMRVSLTPDYDKDIHMSLEA